MWSWVLDREGEICKILAPALTRGAGVRPRVILAAPDPRVHAVQCWQVSVKRREKQQVRKAGRIL